MRTFIAKPFAARYAGSIVRYALTLALCATPIVDVHGFVPKSDDIFQHFDGVNLVWHDVESVNVGGVVIRTAAFKSSDSADSLAHKFTTATTIFDRLLTMPGHRVLSGVRDGWHWLAQINVSSSGAYGYVSALQAASVPAIASPSWLPAHPRALFSFSDVVKGKRVTQHVHHFTETVSALRINIKQWLTQQGWKRQKNHDAADNTWQWYRPGEHLSIMMIPDKEGVLMYTHSIFYGKRK